MSKVFIEESTLTSIGDAIRAKAGTTELIAPQNMGEAITNLPSGGGDLPEEALIVTGKCQYRFAHNGWNWFIENYGNRVTTTNIEDMNYMFSYSTKLERIPFAINCKSNISITLEYAFNSCWNLKSIPKINNCKPSSFNYLFCSCHSLRNLPEDFADWFDYSYLDNLTSAYSGSQKGMFSGCRSLRSIPMAFLEHGNPKAYSGYAYFSEGFNSCYALDELVGLPIPYTATWTDSAFYRAFAECNRLKNITFAMPNGQPYTVNWKSQTIDCSNCVGYASGEGNALTYIVKSNAGITADKLVKDDAAYQALKNDPDWFTWGPEYSRYNHDSAVATINSLPDTSAYLASAGGTNTIKFKGAAGSATDGGAINTLTETEIAVATAKGWTVSLV